MHPIKTIIVSTLGVLTTLLIMGASKEKLASNDCPPEEVIARESHDILTRADKYLHSEVRTVVHDTSERSSGGKHDFYSEGDYWWPNPSNPDGPYIRRDGESNPNNFMRGS